MQPNINFREASELKSGDVILCYCNPNKNFVANKIRAVTGSEYCHAAIYYGNSIVAESTAKDGIKGKVGKTDISDLLSRYEHVAVLRNPDAFASEYRVKILKLFIDKIVESGAKYNFNGILLFKKRKKQHGLNFLKKLENFFNGDQNPPQFEKGSYFCSEFVCDCHIAVGFIDASAAVLYESEIYSPGDLGRDPTFGTFWGYLTAKHNYTVSEGDIFYKTSTYDSIFRK